LLHQSLFVRRAAQLVVGLSIVATAVAISPRVQAHAGDAGDSIRQFLAQHKTQPAYRALRRLEARSGDKQGWMEAMTTYSAETGFDYEIMAEGGSGVIRTKVLRAVLQGEREAMNQGETATAALVLANYTFAPMGVDDDGLANVLLSPRRKEPVLVVGTMFLQPAHGDLVRLEGRLAKSPSFWLKTVDIIQKYERVTGVVVPVALESKAQLRFFGSATLRMTYEYSEIDGRTVSSEFAQRY
jgi:hypothetical protein